MPYATAPDVHHDHDDVRRWLRQLRTALACPTAPPAGHAFWGILAAARTYLTETLPADMAAEEALVFGRARAGDPGGDPGGALDAMRSEHVALRLLMSALDEALADLPLDGRRWDAARVLAVALESALLGHMAREEATLRALDRREPPRPAPLLAV